MNEVKQIGNYKQGGAWDNPQTGRVYSPDGLSPTLNTCGGGDREVKIVEPQVKKAFDLPKEIINDNERQRRVYDTSGISPSILSRQDSPKIYQLGNINPNETGQSGTVYDAKGISPTLDTCQGGNRMPKIVEPMIVASRGRNPQNPSDRTPGNHVEQRLEPNSEGICNTLTSVQKDNLVLEPQLKIVDIPQTVSVRKHKVDIESLKKTLREHKKITNKEIAQKLDKPITMVEHWFRKDNSFSIPDADIWYQLKELLGITTDEFDLQITEFIEQDGVFEKANRCYMTDGISPTLTSASADEKILEPFAIDEQNMRVRNETFGTLTTDGSSPKHNNRAFDNTYRIRKLTPLECWRLMDFTDEDFEKAEAVNSNTQLYKQAGNSIVKAVLMAIFKQMM